MPDRHPRAPAEHEVLMHRVHLGPESQEATTMVRMIVLPEVAKAAVCYVPIAIEYIDDVDLPLSMGGFAEHIEEFAAAH
ncbi:hypothetical protein M271_00085 [Streptomyces rapamycinicus NRRL 5491]|nr:hypothetical protein M271_00085 [Streptomyces rapamycinicus NRRL 5491]